MEILINSALATTHPSVGPGSTLSGPCFRQLVALATVDIRMHHLLQMQQIFGMACVYVCVRAIVQTLPAI